jgi:hypothetical protein
MKENVGYMPVGDNHIINIDAVNTVKTVDVAR